MTDKPTSLVIRQDQYGWRRNIYTADGACVAVVLCGERTQGAVEDETRTFVSSFNAVVALASHLNRDPVALAKELADGGLVELVSIVRRWEALDGGSWHPDRHAANKAELTADSRAILSRLRECGK